MRWHWRTHQKLTTAPRTYPVKIPVKSVAVKFVTCRGGQTKHTKAGKHWFWADFVLVESVLLFEKNSRKSTMWNEWFIDFEHKNDSSLMLGTFCSTSKALWSLICRISDSRIVLEMLEQFSEMRSSDNQCLSTSGCENKPFVLFGHHGMWRVSQQRVHFWRVSTEWKCSISIYWEVLPIRWLNYLVVSNYYFGDCHVAK